MKNLLLSILGLGIIVLAIILFIKEGSTENKTGDSSFELALKTVETNDGEELSFRLAEGLNITIASEGLGKARFMAMSPDERLFVPDLVNYNLSHQGRLMILEDFDEETKRFRKQTEYLSDLRGPNSVAFYTDNDGEEWLYLALTEHLVRYPYEEGDAEPSGEAEVIFAFDNAQSPGADNSVWHITRTIMFEEDTLFVSSGSGCNACEQPNDERRAMILTMTPLGEDVEIFAEGIRNAVGIAWANGDLYATENGVDHLGAGTPNDLVYKVEKREHHGWPYCYELDGEKFTDDSREWEEDFDCNNTPLSFASFKAHSAPLGITYFEGGHSLLENFFLVALHGSHEPEIGGGYEVVRISENGDQETFMDGFLNDGGERVARPVHILQKDNNSFFLTDDLGGRIFYIYAS